MDNARTARTARRMGAAAAVTALVVAPASAHAGFSAPWSPSSPGSNEAPALSVGSGGGAALLWRNRQRQNASIKLAVGDTRQGFRNSIESTYDSGTADPNRPLSNVMDADGDTLATWYAGGDVRVAFRPAGSPPRQPVTFGRFASVQGLAFDPKGNAYLAVADGSGRVFLASRPEGAAADAPSAGFRTPVRLSSERGISSVVFAFDRRGNALVGWSGATATRAYVETLRRSSDGTLGSVDRLASGPVFTYPSGPSEARTAGGAPPEPSVAGLRFAATPAGRVVAVWNRSRRRGDVGDVQVADSTVTRGFVGDAVAPIGFRGAIPQVALSARGDTTIVAQATKADVISRVRPAGGRAFGPARRIPRFPGAHFATLYGLAGNARGDALVALFEGSRPAAAARRGNGPFGVPGGLAPRSPSGPPSAIGVGLDANGRGIGATTQLAGPGLVQQLYVSTYTP